MKFMEQFGHMGGKSTTISTHYDHPPRLIASGTVHTTPSKVGINYGLKHEAGLHLAYKTTLAMLTWGGNKGEKQGDQFAVVAICYCILGAQPEEGEQNWHGFAMDC